MSLISEYRKTDRDLQFLNEKLETLRSSTQYQQELEFEHDILAVMRKHNKSLADAIKLLDPENLLNKPIVIGKRSLKARKTMEYKNPHTGEVIHTKGSNKKVREWRSEFGDDVVDRWIRILD